MKISELQELLDRAEKQYGDLEVNVLKRTSMVHSDYFEINTVNIVRDSEPEKIEVGEQLSELGNPILYLDYIAPPDEEDELDE